MKTKHTPGPWETSSTASGDWDVCEQDAGDMIANLKGTNNQEANARLIAAAPELLAALEDVLDADGDLDAMDFDRYRAAIAKAVQS